MSDEKLKRRTKSRTKGDQTRKRAGLVTKIRDLQRQQERLEALALARSLALAGLPRRRAKSRTLTRTVRTGLDTWVRITYHAQPGCELPFGQDRLVLAGVQHLAIQHDNPRIYFAQAGELLKLFGLPTDGRELALLRERFGRLNGLTIALDVAGSREELEQKNEGEQTFVIRRYSLPSRERLRQEQLEAAGQQRLGSDALWLSSDARRYGVELSRDFFAYLQEPSHRLLVPLDLLRLFVDRPVAWDYAVFLVARCGAARTLSVIEHDVLLEMFRDGTEPDRKTFERLRDYHTEIVRATGGRLNASFEEARPERSTGGRPKKRWCLRVGPSEPLLGGSVAGRLPIPSVPIRRETLPT